MVVAGRVDRLRQVDDHRAIRTEQDVELGEVAVHQAGAEHGNDLADQESVVAPCLVGLQRHVVETRRSIAVGVRHQFHQQHAIEEIIGLRHPHTGSGETEQGRHFGILPGFLLFAAAILRALGHGPRLAAVADLAALLVLGGLAEAALVGFLVDLGATQAVAATHHIDRGFLAAHQRAHDLVDQTVFDQRFQASGCLHRCYAVPRGQCGRQRV